MDLVLGHSAKPGPCGPGFRMSRVVDPSISCLLAAPLPLIPSPQKQYVCMWYKQILFFLKFLNREDGKSGEDRWFQDWEYVIHGSVRCWKLDVRCSTFDLLNVWKFRVPRFTGFHRGPFTARVPETPVHSVLLLLLILIVIVLVIVLNSATVDCE